VSGVAGEYLSHEFCVVATRPHWMSDDRTDIITAYVDVCFLFGHTAVMFQVGFGHKFYETLNEQKT